MERPRQAGRPGGDGESVHLRRRKWNILAAYGAQRRLGQDGEAGQDYLPSSSSNVVVAGQERAATRYNTFLAGKGDVLLTYESEAIFAQKNGKTSSS